MRLTHCALEVVVLLVFGKRMGAEHTPMARWIRCVCEHPLSCHELARFRIKVIYVCCCVSDIYGVQYNGQVVPETSFSYNNSISTVALGRSLGAHA